MKNFIYKSVNAILNLGFITSIVLIVILLHIGISFGNDSAPSTLYIGLTCGYIALVLFAFCFLFDFSPLEHISSFIHGLAFIASLISSSILLAYGLEQQKIILLSLFIATDVIFFFYIFFMSIRREGRFYSYEYKLALVKAKKGQGKLPIDMSESPVLSNYFSKKWGRVYDKYGEDGLRRKFLHKQYSLPEKVLYIKKVYEGESLEEVSSSYYLNPKELELWLKTYEEKGLEGLKNPYFNNILKAEHLELQMLRNIKAPSHN